jgi:hypothetical protein
MLAATTAFATSTQTASIPVSANMTSNRLISANPLAFGSSDELGANEGRYFLDSIHSSVLDQEADFVPLQRS